MLASRVDVSVVLPLHGSWWSDEDLELAVRSLVAQEFTGWRLVVVDSTLRASGLLRELVPQAKLDLEPLLVRGRGGVQDCLWQALAGTRSKWIGYLDPGAVWDPTHLTRLVSVGRSYELDVVFSGTERSADGFWNQIPGELRDGNVADQAAVLHTENIYRKTTGWRRGQSYLSDWDLWLRMAKAGARFGHVALRTMERRRSSHETVGRFGPSAVKEQIHSEEDVFTAAELTEMEAIDVEIAESMRAEAEMSRLARLGA